VDVFFLKHGVYELVFGILLMVMGCSYERAWRVFTEMEQLQIKRLWERACWAYR